MKALAPVVDLVAGVSRALATLLSFVILAVLLAGVFFRFVLDSSLQWSDEVAVWSMNWMVWIGAIAVMRRWEHVHIPLFLRLLPLRARIFFVPLAKLLTLACLVVIVWYGVQVFQGTFHISSPTTGISTRWIKLAIPVGAAAMALSVIALLAEDVGRALRNDLGYFGRYGHADEEETVRSAAERITERAA